MPGVDIGAGIGGGISGAGTGFAIGGPVGAGIGGALGLAGGLFGSGRKKKKKLSTMDKRQQQLNESQYEALQGRGEMADLYTYNPDQANDMFNKTVSDPAYREYQEKLAPELTGQFRSQGLQTSSYAGDALARLARDVQSGLDAKRSQFMFGQQQDVNNARRSAVENLQNRSMFDYEKPHGIDQILAGFSPEQKNQLGAMFGSMGQKPTNAQRWADYSAGSALK